jgi:hypothetical protein
VNLRRTTAAVSGLLVALVTAAVGAAQPALAASSIALSPAPDSSSVYSASVASIRVSAAVARCTTILSSDCPTVTLQVHGPSGTTSAAKKESQSGTTTVSVDAPTGGQNGQWTATLGGATSGSRTYYTNFPPAAPVTNAPLSDGRRTVTLSWQRGSDPAVTGFFLYDAKADAKISDPGTSDGSVPLSACHSDGTCTYALTYDNTTPGTYGYAYQVTALGTSCGTPCGPYVESARSQQMTATLVTPAPSPSASPSSGGTGGTAGGATSGGTAGGTAGGSTTGTSGTASHPGSGSGLPTLADPVTAQRRAFALSFNSFSPSLGIPKLPPLPDTPPTVDRQPLPQGTYLPQLPYKPTTVTDKTTNILADPLSTVTSLDRAGLARSLAVALILVAAAAHLRRYLSLHTEDE